MSTGPRTLDYRLTKGDSATQPGGVILRQLSSGEFVAHHFTREWNSLEPTSFFWGSYSDDEAKARGAFNEKVSRQSHALITDAQALMEKKP